MLRRLYDATLALAGHRRARPALMAVSFAESSVFPIPPDVLLVPMVLADRARTWIYARDCTLASVAGAVVGYFIGHYAWVEIGDPLMAFYGGEAAFAQFEAFYDTYGLWIVIAAAVSFLPFKVATLASGVAGIGIFGFVLASLAGRGLRFFAVAALAHRFGPDILRLVDRYFGAATLLFLLVLAAGFALIAGGGA